MPKAARTTFSVRIEAGLKDQFDDFCDEVGINASIAFNMFIRAVLREKRLPFDVTTDPVRLHPKAASLPETMNDMPAWRSSAQISSIRNPQ